MSADLRSVELVQAFLWTCDDCGRDNFERAVTASPEAIDPDDIPGEIQEYVDEDSGEGAWVMAPKIVRCRYCGSEFATTEPGG